MVLNIWCTANVRRAKSKHTTTTIRKLWRSNSHFFTNLFFVLFVWRSHCWQTNLVDNSNGCRLCCRLYIFACMAEFRTPTNIHNVAQCETSDLAGPISRRIRLQCEQNQPKGSPALCWRTVCTTWNLNSNCWHFYCFYYWCLVFAALWKHTTTLSTGCSNKWNIWAIWLISMQRQPMNIWNFRMCWTILRTINQRDCTIQPILCTMWA